MMQFLVVYLVVFLAAPYSIQTKVVQDYWNKVNSDFIFAAGYNDHMVLQRGPQSATVWGYADLSDLGKNVTVILTGSGTKQMATGSVRPAPERGRAVWFVVLSPVTDPSAYVVTAQLAGYDQITLTDVLFGDVWLCSGQSNMQFTIDQIFGHQGVIQDAKNYGKIRLLNIDRVVSDQPLYDIKKIIFPWMPPASAFSLGKSNGIWEGFSAVCYLFGVHLHNKLGYPIGLIDSTWGGTPVESWSDSLTLAKCGLDRTDHYMEEDEMKFGANDPPPHTNSVLWNAMIHPLLNVTIKGVIWYQGEANTNYHTEAYSCSFPSMIESWRNHFTEGTQGQVPPSMPFGFVQIGPIIADSPVTEFGYPAIRWHQMMDDVRGLPLKNSFMAVAMDLTDNISSSDSVHIRDKQTVAARLARAALNNIYIPQTISTSPFPTSEEVQQTGMIISFSYHLAEINIRTNDGFEVCCASTYDKCPMNSTVNWVAATIVKSNSTSLWLSWAECGEIAAYRYAWRATPCQYHLCAVYSDLTGDPLPTFTKPLKTSIYPGYIPSLRRHAISK